MELSTTTTSALCNYAGQYLLNKSSAYFNNNTNNNVKLKSTIIDNICTTTAKNYNDNDDNDDNDDDDDTHNCQTHHHRLLFVGPPHFRHYHDTMADCRSTDVACNVEMCLVAQYSATIFERDDTAAANDYRCGGRHIDWPPTHGDSDSDRFCWPPPTTASTPTNNSLAPLCLTEILKRSCCSHLQHIPYVDSFHSQYTHTVNDYVYVYVYENKNKNKDDQQICYTNETICDANNKLDNPNILPKYKLKLCTKPTCDEDNDYSTNIVTQLQCSSKLLLLLCTSVSAIASTIAEKTAKAASSLSSCVLVSVLPQVINNNNNNNNNNDNNYVNNDEKHLIGSVSSLLSSSSMATATRTVTATATANVASSCLSMIKLLIAKDVLRRKRKMLNLCYQLSIVLVIILSLGLIDISEAGTCWLKRMENGKCRNAYTRNITKSECCKMGKGTGFTEKEMSEVEFFFATAIGDGASCVSCLESCETAQCGQEKRCIVRRGRPKCVCAPVCRSSKEKKTIPNFRVIEVNQRTRSAHLHQNHHNSRNSNLNAAAAQKLIRNTAAVIASSHNNHNNHNNQRRQLHDGHNADADDANVDEDQYGSLPASVRGVRNKNQRNVKISFGRPATVHLTLIDASAPDVRDTDTRHAVAATNRTATVGRVVAVRANRTAAGAGAPLLPYHRGRHFGSPRRRKYDLDGVEAATANATAIKSSMLADKFRTGQFNRNAAAAAVAAGTAADTDKELRETAASGATFTVRNDFFPNDITQQHHGPFYNPVCGSDGRTYKTECQLKKRACRQESTLLTVAYRGHCQTSCRLVTCATGQHCVEDQNSMPHCVYCSRKCPAVAEPNGGDLNGIANHSPPKMFSQFLSLPSGGGGGGDATASSASSATSALLSSMRTVCGVDGHTYPTLCELKQKACTSGRAIAVAYKGPCQEAANCGNIKCKDKQICLTDLLTHKPRCVSCSFKCPRRRRPPGRRVEATATTTKVCGTNNHTYHSWCHMIKDSCHTGFYIDIKHNDVCIQDRAQYHPSTMIPNK